MTTASMEIRIIFGRECHPPAVFEHGTDERLESGEENRKGLRDKILKGRQHLETLKVGLVSTDTESTRLLDVTLPELETTLQSLFPDFRWQVERLEIPEELSGPGALHYFEIANEVLVRRNLHFAFTVTCCAIDMGKHPSAVALASRSLSAAVIPLRLLWPGGTPISEAMRDELEIRVLQKRFDNLFLHLLGLLCGLEERDGTGSVMEREEPFQASNEELTFTKRELEIMSERLEDMAELRTEHRFPNIGLALFYLRVLFAHPVRILRVAMSNKPWKLVTKLHKLVFPAVVTVPIALLSQELWHLGVNQSTRRLAAITFAIIAAATVFIVLKQKLWRKMPPGAKSEQVAVLNLSSMLSIILAVALVLAVIFACTLALTAGIFPRRVIGSWLNGRGLSAGDYVRVSFFIACLASVVGWLGAGFTESDEFRLMLYTNTRPR